MLKNVGNRVKAVVLNFQLSFYCKGTPVVFQLFLTRLEQLSFYCTYLCIKASTLRFLDIKHFLAPSFSYRKFLIAYGSELEKFYFSYEFVDSLEKLESDLPNHQAFYSSLTKSNITTEEYALVQKNVVEKRMEEFA